MPETVDPEYVRRLHAGGLTVVGIARHLRCRTEPVSAVIRALGLRITREWLEEHYFRRREPIESVAAKWGISEAAVRYHLNKHAIPIRYKSRGSIRNRMLADADWLRTVYLEELRSLQEIADLARCRVSSVRSALTRHGISRRIHPKGRYASRTRLFVGKARRLILERDGYQCRWPGCGATEMLEVNHILPMEDGGESTFNNGITLCRTHHRLIRKRESEFAEQFRRLVLGPLT